MLLTVVAVVLPRLSRYVRSSCLVGGSLRLALFSVRGVAAPIGLTQRQHVDSFRNARLRFAVCYGVLTCVVRPCYTPL